MSLDESMERLKVYEQIAEKFIIYDKEYCGVTDNYLFIGYLDGILRPIPLYSGVFHGHTLSLKTLEDL